MTKGKGNTRLSHYGSERWQIPILLSAFLPSPLVSFLISPLLLSKKLPNLSKRHDGRFSANTAPMKSNSGVLESSQTALSTEMGFEADERLPSRKYTQKDTGKVTNNCMRGELDFSQGNNNWLQHNIRASQSNIIISRENYSRRQSDPHNNRIELKVLSLLIRTTLRKIRRLKKITR